MCKVETTRKVSLELTTRTNLRRQDARAKLSILDIVHKPLRSLKRVIRLSSSKKGPIAPTGTIINPFKIDKTAANDNLGQCLKEGTTSKVSLELTTRKNLRWRGARAKLSILDIVHKPLRRLERVILK